MPKVLNAWLLTKAPPNAVFVGTGTKWQSPFSHHPNTNNPKVKYKLVSHHTSVEAYERYLNMLLERNPKLRDEIISELAGRDLICFCEPFPCHADVLLKIANPQLHRKETNEYV